MSSLEQLKLLQREILDLGAAAGLMGWDQETYMPPKALAPRARQRSVLAGLIHSKSTDAEIGRLLDSAERELGGASASDMDRAIVAEARYDYERSRKLPGELVRELSETAALAAGVWADARARSDFKMFAPHLERIVKLLRRKADAYGFVESPYDALIEDYERGMTAAQIRPIFERLARELRRMVAAIASAPNPPNREILHRRYDAQKQWDFGMKVLAEMGFDLEAGRQDKSAHPFTSGTHPLDIRLTTRISESEFSMGLFATMHEGGHGIYEQGFPFALHDTVLCGAPSLGLHESQSRLWENEIGRRRSFWRHYFPIARETFPGALEDVGEEEFYRAINRSEPSFIRVEADELTYGLHIILRFEIEQGLIEGALRVKDLPELWAAKMKEHLGIVPPDDARGVLQDIHWSHASMGYFPTYALGSLYASQIFNALCRDLGDVDALLARGEMIPIRDWLNLHIHRWGRMKSADEIVALACGEGLNAQPFLDYAAVKFGAIYGVDLSGE